MRLSRRQTLSLIGGALVSPISFRAFADPFGPLATVSKLGTAFRVDTNQTGSLLAPRIVARDAGGFIVTWLRQSGGLQEYYARYFGPTGTALTAPVKIFSPPLLDNVAGNGNPVANADGTALIVFQDDDDARFFQSIFAQKMTTARTKNGNAFRVSQATTTHLRDPIACRLVNKNVLVAWVDDLKNIRGRIIGATGAVVTNDAFLTAERNKGMKLLALAPLTGAPPTGGGAVFAYSVADASFPPKWTYKLQRLTATGARVGSAITIRSVGLELESNVGLTGLKNGGFAVFYNDLDPFISQGQFIGKLYSNAGLLTRTFLPPIPTIPNDQELDPVAAITADGRILVVTSYNKQGAIKKSKLRAYLLSAAGVKLLGPVDITSYVNVSNVYNVLGGLVRQKDGTFVAVWDIWTGTPSNYRSFAIRIKVT